MHQPPRRWLSWRLAPAPRPAGPAAPDAVANRMRPPAPASPFADPVPAAVRAEAPGPDGVRHGLVAHVRGLIAAGEYDGPDVWAAAEDRLLQAVLDAD